MKTLFFSCLFLLIPGLLIRIPVGGSGILATDILVPIFGMIWLFQKGVIYQKIKHPIFLIPSLLFLSVAFFSFLVGSVELDSFKEILLSGSYGIRFASFLIFGWAAFDFFRTKTEQEHFFKYTEAIVTIVVLLGYIQFIFVPDISAWSTEGGLDPHIGRLLGTWLDPNFMAGLIALFIPIFIGRWYTQKKKMKYGILIALLCGALFLTFSRSGYLASAFGLFIFFLLRDPKIILIGVLCVTIGVLSNERAQKRVMGLIGTIESILFHETDEIDPTAGHRITSWTQSLVLWEESPFLGIGYNTYRYKAAEKGIIDETYFSSGGSDSTHLTILITTGILGIIPFLWFFGRLFLAPLRWYRRSKNEVFLGFSAGIAALFIHGFFVNSLLFPFLFLPVIAYFGVLENKSKS